MKIIKNLAFAALMARAVTLDESICARLTALRTETAEGDPGNDLAADIDAVLTAPAAPCP